jgi:phosphate starvation-inducible PhoH-like protein
MTPLYDSLSKLAGYDGEQREKLDASIEVAPLAYMRGRTFDNATCIFDEAQNATLSQLRLFMSRFGENSKIIITGDPSQSDLPHNQGALTDVMRRLETVPGIGIHHFSDKDIVRHPLVGQILERLGE